MTNFVREVKAGGGRPAPGTVTVRPPAGAVRGRVKRGCWDTQTRLAETLPQTHRAKEELQASRPSEETLTAKSERDWGNCLKSSGKEAEICGRCWERPWS